MRVGIAGGGLGGLSAALFLLRAGVRGRARVRAAVAAERDRRGHPGRAQRGPAAAAARARRRADRRSRCRSRSRGSSGAGRTGASSSRQSFGAEGEAALRRAVPGDPPRATCCACWPTAVPPTASSSWAGTCRGRRRRPLRVRGRLVVGAVRRADRRRRHPLRRARGDRRPGLAASSPASPPTARWCPPRRRRSSPAARSARSGSARTGTSSTTRCPAGEQVNLVTANPAGDWREESWTAPGHRRGLPRRVRGLGRGRRCS